VEREMGRRGGERRREEGRKEEGGTEGKRKGLFLSLLEPEKQGGRVEKAEKKKNLFPPLPPSGPNDSRCYDTRHAPMMSQRRDVGTPAAPKIPNPSVIFVLPQSTPPNSCPHSNG